MALLLRLLGLASAFLFVACGARRGDFPVERNVVTHCYRALIPQLAGGLEMPERDVADYFSEKLIAKRPLGDLREWSGKFDVEEGDSDWNSWIEVRFEQNAAKKQWLVSGTFLDGWDESKTIHFEKLPVLMLDEDGSAFFKFAGKRCYLFRHQTRGPVLIVELGFYQKEE
jgi:hypothetical protein